MVQTANKPLVLGLMAWVVIVSAHTGTAVGAEGLQKSETLQPVALNHAGIRDLRALEPGLTGSGVKFAVISRSITYIDGEPQYDYRPNMTHDCFKAGQFGFHDGAATEVGISPHSTAICSILLGDDRNASDPAFGQFHYQGVAPAADADVYEFWHFVSNNILPGLKPDADIVTASIGNQSEHWWTRGIESLVERYGLIVVAGIGNGLDVNDPVLYPGAGANAIGVGVVDSVNTEDPATNLSHFALAYPRHSSFGPTTDGRCKPDIVAPGNCLAADGNDPNSYKATGDYSSFSTPIVAGTIGLLLQKAKADPNLSPAVSQDGASCVIKAILMNSATKLPYWHKGQLEKDDDHEAPLDCIQGAGMLNAAGAYKHLVAGAGKPGNVGVIGWDNNRLDKSDNPASVYKIKIAEPAEKSITATAVWNRHYSKTYPFAPVPEQDADLRLELCEYEIVLYHSDAEGHDQAHTPQQYGLAWNVAAAPGTDDVLWYDLNADGIVDDSDFFGTLIKDWITHKGPGGYFHGDTNSDGVFDEKDLQDFMGRFGLEADWHTK
jgi:hypothetical protein